MGWNGSGQVVRTNGVFSGADTWEQSRLAGRLVRSDDQDTHDEDLATAIEDTVNRNGENAANANLPMGGFRHTNVSDAQAMTDYATASQLVNNTLQFVPALGVGGTGDAITLSPQVAPTSYNAGQRFQFVAEAVNTGPVTVNVAGLGNIALVRSGLLALPAAAIRVGDLVNILFDGTQFQLLHPESGGVETIEILDVAGQSNAVFNNITMDRYDQLELSFSTVVPATENDALRIEISENNGASYMNTGYAFSFVRVDSGSATVGTLRSNGTTNWTLATGVDSRGLSGTLTLPTTATGGDELIAQWTGGNRNFADANFIAYAGSALVFITGSFNAIRVSWATSATFLRGRIILRGVRF